jgi:hypothetical protein
LTARRPFPEGPIGSDFVAAIEDLIHIRREGLPAAALAQLPADCPPDLVEILARCLAPAPEDRFASAGHLARRLELCLQPRLQRFLRPATHGWRAWAARHALAAILISGLCANLLASALNIAYNRAEIIVPVGPAAEAVFARLLWIVNPILYGAAVALLLRLAWPVLRSVRTAAAAGARRPRAPPFVSSRSLWLGDYVAGVTAVAWLVSGVMFPVWLQAEAAEGAGLGFSEYVHFMSSQVVCGLIAATQSFFLVTFLNLRVFFGLLVDLETYDAAISQALRALAVRGRYYFLLAVSVPLIAIVPLARVDSGRLAVLCLGGLGFVAFLWAYRLTQEIQIDLDAFAVATGPAGPALESGDVDSFWVQSR